MANSFNYDMLWFLLAAIAGSILYLVICKILTDNNEDEDVSFFRPAIGVVLSFIALIKTTEPGKKRISYLILLFSLVLISVFSIVVFFRGAYLFFYPDQT